MCSVQAYHNNIIYKVQSPKNLPPHYMSMYELHSILRKIIALFYVKIHLNQKYGFNHGLQPLFSKFGNHACVQYKRTIIT
jgi:hypothetical protein